MLARRVAAHARWHFRGSRFYKSNTAKVLLSPSVESQTLLCIRSNRAWISRYEYVVHGQRLYSTSESYEAAGNEVGGGKDGSMVEELANDTGIPSTTDSFLRTELDRHLDVEEELDKIESDFISGAPEVISYPDPVSPITSGIDAVAERPELEETTSSKELVTGTPIICPGCGAKSHSLDSTQPGYYSSKELIHKKGMSEEQLTYVKRRREQKRVYTEALSRMTPNIRELMRQANMELPPKDENKMGGVEDGSQEEEDDGLPLVLDYTGLDPRSEESLAWLDAIESFSLPAQEDDIDQDSTESTSQEAICARCRRLLHHTEKLSDIPDVTYSQVAEIIANSPFNRIHIYHAIDAADFPMSALPQAKKRILQAMKDFKDWKKKDVTLSYVITRADTLMPTEDKVTSLMTYTRRILSSHLGEEASLNDLRLVSAKRHWTTERLKDEIRARKGGVFLLGKTNVGKSRLFEAIFPKRNNKEVDFNKNKFGKADLNDLSLEPLTLEQDYATNDGFVQNGQKVLYPKMPVVSRIPGTTVGPISIDFAAGRGQLVDLPGFARGGLLKYINEAHHKDVIMVDRVKPEPQVVANTKVYILGGLVTIRAVTPEPVEGKPTNIPTLIIYPFTNIRSHVARDLKVKRYTDPDLARGHIYFDHLKNPEFKEELRTAGVFKLTKDVTKDHIPSLPGRNKEVWIDKNIFWQVMAVDILIEGCGWLEVTAQIRKGDPLPEIEVCSPEGKGIGCRETLEAYMKNKKPNSKPSPGSRPKYSKKGEKKRLKEQSRGL